MRDAIPARRRREIESREFASRERYGIGEREANLVAPVVDDHDTRRLEVQAFYDQGQIICAACAANGIGRFALQMKFLPDTPCDRGPHTIGGAARASR